jgi:hypothetical protein
MTASGGWLSRLTVSIGLVTTLSALAVTPVLGAKPDREYLEPETFIIEDACEFPVELADTKVRFKETLWERPDGTFVLIGNGQWLTRLTNLDSGASIVVSISGPEFVRIRDEEFSDVGTGAWLQWGFADGGLFLTHGRFEWVGETIEDAVATLHGHSQDMCVRLGD